MRYIQPLRRAAIVIAAVLVLVTSVGAVAMAGGPRVDTALLALFQTPNAGLPAVAARVDGQAISGQYLSYAIKQYQDEASAAGQTLSRKDAVDKALDRLASAAATEREATQRGYVVSDADITAYLTTQTDRALQVDGDVAQTVWEANGYATAQEYIQDPAVRGVARQMLLGSKMFSDMTKADPGFDVQSFVAKLKASVDVEVLFTP